MQKMCLNCKYFEQTEEQIKNELTLGRCTQEKMIQHFNPEEYTPGTIIRCIFFKVKSDITDSEDSLGVLRNESRSRGARSVLDALEKKNPSLRRKEADDEKE